MGKLLNSIAFSQRRYVWKLCKFLGETVEMLYHKISIWLWIDNNRVRYDGDGGESVESVESVESGVLFTFERGSREQFYHSLASETALEGSPLNSLPAPCFFSFFQHNSNPSNSPLNPRRLSFDT